ncbi:MAG: hypothetical protein Q8M07_01080 [Prosthecobacter sp.]|nr:hypothetical protein [Prosthecobacter sp.]
MAGPRFSYEWGDPAAHVEFSSAARKQQVDVAAQAAGLFVAPVRQQQRRAMRIGMRVWDLEVLRG